jgi:hypothetical protein
LSLTVPLAASATPSDAGVRLAYRDLAVSEEVWSLIDPTGAVPRNPLTVVLDATAQVQLMVDLMSADAMAMDRPPGDLRALSVSELEVTFGGTSLTGSADMTFAPGQMPPMPVGRADLSLVGGNALLDQLQGAGVVDAQQAGMARGVAACSPARARCPTRSRRPSSSWKAAASRRTGFRSSRRHRDHRLAPSGAFP